MDFPEFEKRGESKQLILLLHAYMSSPKRLGAVRQIVAGKLPDADLYVPKLPASWLSMARPTKIVKTLLYKIDKLCAQPEEGDASSEYEKIIFIGHSLGALIARKLYVCACGEIEGVPLEAEIGAKEPRAWASKVERIILLAGMNRGWRVSHHLSLVNAVLWGIGSLWGNLLWLLVGHPPLIFTIRRGAPFITQLRIHWIHMRNHAEARQVGDALTIQLLGSIDDMVSPEDNIDLVSGRDFVYMDVPYSGHANVIDMNDPRPLPSSEEGNVQGSKTIGQARTDVFYDALVKSEEELFADSVLPADLPLKGQRLDVTDVVFVIHGIRDLGFWTHKVARRIKVQAKTEHTVNTIIESETSSYGYFPMLPFMMPTKRKAKVEWLMDQYAEALALYPNATFSFVGHSNGTYLLARALQDYPVCRFKHVVLAGSVIRTRYKWELAKQRGQIKKVLNYVATADWVVAFFPRAIQMLRLQDLGSAGHDGFKLKQSDLPIEQVTYVKGGHGAALKEANWGAIAHFILTGEVLDPPPTIKSDMQSWLVKIPGWVAPLIWVLIGYTVWWVAKMIWISDLPEWGRTVLIAIFALGIWKVVTKV